MIIKPTTYILFSQKDKKTYTGSTNNLIKRLKEHDDGLVKSTCYRRPLQLIYKEEFSLLDDARKREKYFKSCAGRKKLIEILKDKI